MVFPMFCPDWLISVTSWTDDFEVHIYTTFVATWGTSHSELHGIKCLCGWYHDATCNQGWIWNDLEMGFTNLSFNFGRTKYDQNCAEKLLLQEVFSRKCAVWYNTLTILKVRIVSYLPFDRSWWSVLHKSSAEGLMTNPWALWRFWPFTCQH